MSSTEMRMFIDFQSPFIRPIGAPLMIILARYTAGRVSSNTPRRQCCPPEGRKSSINALKRQLSIGVQVALV